ncbi:hypothetical protein C4D60_Mb10t11910 [Musa balbisiana]|uniref:Uncharacterized protein n=1 Tax=Musa balbisiana TaxID=52838 RepID=A0A4S8IWI0_MUSBA|nr:hypothetical protein C4D60_Mb10t11910 [Musa balbisiana]
MMRTATTVAMWVVKTRVAGREMMTAISSMIRWWRSIRRTSFLPGRSGGNLHRRGFISTLIRMRMTAGTARM